LTRRRQDRAAKAEPSAYQRALGLLVRREHSRRELDRKLSARGVEPAERGDALDQLGRQDFQSDHRFAIALARSRAAAGYGPSRIRAELATHQLAREMIDSALAACPGDWAESARLQVSRKFPGTRTSDPAVRRRAAQFLLRRGFDPATAFAVTGSDRGGDDLDP
jgi:regulatory protein